MVQVQSFVVVLQAERVRQVVGTLDEQHCSVVACVVVVGPCSILASDAHSVCVHTSCTFGVRAQTVQGLSCVWSFITTG